MKMKYLFVSLIILLAFAGIATADNQVEIRSTILDFDNATPNFVEPANITPQSWAGFYYKLGDNKGTEQMNFTVNGSNLDIEYTTKPMTVKHDFKDWTAKSLGGIGNEYSVIGFFSEPYVAINGSANKLAPLIKDNSDKYTLTVGDVLEIGGGYSLVIQQIDVNGNKAYLQLMQDGQVIDSGIVNTDVAGSPHPTDARTWVLDKTILGSKNEYLRVHVIQVFQGTQSSLVEIKGIWMIDPDKAFEVKNDVNYGLFKGDVANSTQLTYRAKDVKMSANLTTALGNDISLRTGKKYGDTNWDFYIAKTQTKPGTYEIRSTIRDYNTTGPQAEYNYSNFAAFYYNLNDGTQTEHLTIDFSSSGKIDKGKLEYWTIPSTVGYAHDGWDANKEYWVVGLFGQYYVPFNLKSSGTPTLKAEKLSKLVLDSNDKYVLSVGQTLDLGEGYSISVQQIDVNGNKAYLQFFKDGQEVDSGIVNTNYTGSGANDSKTWEITKSLLGEKDVQVLRVHVVQVFQGTQSSLVEIKGIWLMDYQNVRELKTSDSFGSLDFKSSSGGVLSFESNKNITIAPDSNISLYDNFGIKSSKNTTLTNEVFYLYAMRTIGENEAPPEPPDVITPPTENNTTPPTNNTTPPTNNTTPPTTPTPSTPPKTFWQTYGLIIGGVVLIVIVAAAGGYVYWAKKNGKL